MPLVRRLPGALALTLLIAPALLAPAAHAQSAPPVLRPAPLPPVPPPPPPLPRPAIPTATREQGPTTEVDLESLPMVTLPAPLAMSDRPRDASAPEATGISLTPRTPVDAERLKKPEAVAMRLDAGQSGLVLMGTNGPPPLPGVQAASNVVLRTDVWVSCDGRTTRPLALVHWESITLGASGEASWTISDGWFDARACRVLAGKQVVLKPRVLLSQGDTPLAFGMRTAEGLLVLLPSAEAVVVDSLTGGIRAARGSLPRVLVPVGRGSSATAVAMLSGPRVALWLAAARGAGAPSQTWKATGPITLRVDAAQTVSEAAPVILLSARVPVG